jgi:hypothetical protein
MEALGAPLSIDGVPTGATLMIKGIACDNQFHIFYI